MVTERARDRLRSSSERSRECIYFQCEAEAVRQITQESSDTMEPRWSGDGGVLYVVSKKTGLPQIWKVPLDGIPGFN